jgi:hypothetical protein
MGVPPRWELFVTLSYGGSVANARKKPAAGFPGSGFFKSIIVLRSIVLRRHPSLADLAATYSSKP